MQNFPPNIKSWSTQTPGSALGLHFLCNKSWQIPPSDPNSLLGRICLGFYFMILVQKCLILSSRDLGFASCSRLVAGVEIIFFLFGLVLKHTWGTFIADPCFFGLERQNPRNSKSTKRWSPDPESEKSWWKMWPETDAIWGATLRFPRLKDEKGTT